MNYLNTLNRHWLRLCVILIELHTLLSCKNAPWCWNLCNVRTSCRSTMWTFCSISMRKKKHNIGFRRISITNARTSSIYNRNSDESLAFVIEIQLNALNVWKWNFVGKTIDICWENCVSVCGSIFQVKSNMCLLRLHFNAHSENGLHPVHSLSCKLHLTVKSNTVPLHPKKTIRSIRKIIRHWHRR